MLESRILSIWETSIVIKLSIDWLVHNIQPIALFSEITLSLEPTRVKYKILWFEYRFCGPPKCLKSYPNSSNYHPHPTPLKNQNFFQLKSNFQIEFKRRFNQLKIRGHWKWEMIEDVRIFLLNPYYEVLTIE